MLSSLSVITQLSADERRQRLLEWTSVSLLIDVGANTGQYATRVREAGYCGRIISFEPLPGAFQALALAASGDELWTCFELALSDTEGDAVLNRSGNPLASSLLPMKQLHVDEDPGSQYVGQERITTRRLDSILPQLAGHRANVHLKMDVQGYELHVLRGAEYLLPSISLIEAELSVASLYEGAPSYEDVLSYLAARDFTLVGVGESFEDSVTGRLLQFDAIFARDLKQATDSVS